LSDDGFAEATNAILHSRSGQPDRWFVVRAVLYPGDYAWVEVADQGGAWAVAGDGN
jgi:anti-sigma regulatory factor (Ser/Thr protein kinase)